MFKSEVCAKFIIIKKIATMENNKTNVTIQTTINAPAEKVWEYFTNPEHITKWNHASDDWHSPKAENDLRPGGKFNYRMEAKDGSFGFDFWGVYDIVETNETISYTMGDDRKVNINFSGDNNSTTVKSTFEAESSNPVEMQKNGWQTILDNFKKYTEEN